MQLLNGNSKIGANAVDRTQNEIDGTQTTYDCITIKSVG